MPLVYKAYKKPRRLNAVSISMVLFLGLMGYIGYSFWPPLRLKANVTSQLREALPRVYRANLRAPGVARPTLARVRSELEEALLNLGIAKRELELEIERNKEMVAIEARFATHVLFPGLDKRWRLPLSSRVETDAARVEW